MLAYAYVFSCQRRNDPLCNRVYHLQCVGANFEVTSRQLISALGSHGSNYPMTIRQRWNGRCKRDELGPPNARISWTGLWSLSLLLQEHPEVDHSLPGCKSSLVTLACSLFWVLCHTTNISLNQSPAGQTKSRLEFLLPAGDWGAWRSVPIVCVIKSAAFWHHWHYHSTYSCTRGWNTKWRSDLFLDNSSIILSLEVTVAVKAYLDKSHC